MAASNSVSKRHNFTDAEDMLLLKQAIVVKPHAQKHGLVMGKWEEIAATLFVCPEFDIDKLSTKTAQNRFNSLLGMYWRNVVMIVVVLQNCSVCLAFDVLFIASY